MENLQTNYPNLNKVIGFIEELSPFQKKSVQKYLNSANKRYFDFAESVVKRMLPIVKESGDEAFKKIAETYLWYTKTIRVEEMYFQKNGSYRYNEFDTVYDKVYGRDDYMNNYVVGLGMTQIFWPNHWDIFQFFLDEFLPTVKEGEFGAELGVGHGLFHSEFLKACPKMRSKLLDISPSSLQTTLKMIKETGLDPNRATPIKCDVQKDNPLEDHSLDALLMGEIIEHIQDGARVMAEMSKKMKPTGRCYFSTAANSPAEDHILLFKTVDEIRTFIKKAGWKINKEHLGTLNGLSVEESEKGNHNINYAAVLSV